MTMTRKDAIVMLKSKMDGSVDTSYEWAEALRMAIEALKTEPIRCGECENYIERRCIEVNHHVAAHGNCMGVFGAKRREL